MTIMFPQSLLRTALLLFATIFMYAHATSAEASDIRAVNALPAEGATFYTTDTITFLGTVENMVSENLPEVGFADIEIDWGSDGGPVNYNANPDNSENRLGPISSGGTLQLKEVVSSPPLGTHKYRFFADTADDLPGETDEDVNNFSPWVTFTVVPVPVAPTITFSGAPNPVTLGGSATLTWTVTDATSCTGSNGSGGWSGSKNAGGGNQSVSPVVTTLYTISCTGPGGSATKSFTVDVVTPAPTISLTSSANPINSGSSATLTWSTTNADTCTASDGWSGGKALSGTQLVSPITTTSYTLSCTGPGGTTVVTQVVSVNGSLPGITITATPNPVTSGGSVTLSWSVTDATSCSGASGWSGTKSIPSGTQTVNPTLPTTYRLTCTGPGGVNSNEVVVGISGSPDLMVPFWKIRTPVTRLQIHTSVGSTTAQPLTEGQANTFRALVSNISATAGTIAGFTNRFWYNWGWTGALPLGASSSTPLAALSTTTTYTESPSFTPDRSGLLEVQFCADYLPYVISEVNESNNCAWRTFNVAGASGSPSTTMTMTNAFGTSTLNGQIVYVVSRAVLGSTSTITWHTDRAVSCVGSSNPVDPVWDNAFKNPVTGSVDVSPNATTSYSLLCTGPNGKTIKSVRMYLVVGLPQVTFTGPVSAITRGSSADLAWNVTSARSCTGTSNPSDPNWNGHKNRVSGTFSVTPLVDTKYTLTCESPVGTGYPGGTVSKEFTVAVTDPPPVISLSATPNPITPADATTLSWSATGASNCTGTSNPSDGTWNGVRSIGESPIVVEPDVTTTYTLTCVGPTGSSANTDFTVSVSERPPIIDFSLNDDIIIANKESATFLWDIRGASSCTGVSNPPDSDWDNFNFNADFSSSKTVSPTITTTYSIECSGPWGENSGQPRTINVVPEAKITEFKVCVDAPGGECRSINETLEVNPGTPLTVEWDSDDATSCSAVSGGAHSHTFSTSGNPSGTDPDVWATSYADSTDTYTIACGSAGFLTSEFVSVTVHTNSVLPAIWITPKVVQPSGGNISVGWDTNNGDQSICSIKGGGLTNSRLQNSGETGSSSVPVLGRTSFVITCPSKDGLDTESATTTVELSPRIWGR